MDPTLCQLKWETFAMDDMENLTEYRRRLRVLVEDLTLNGMTKKLEEIFIVWKRGLITVFKEWLNFIERGFPNPGTQVEVIYRLERLVQKKGGGLEIDDIVFLVSDQTDKPRPPDFHIWKSMKNGAIYAHDVRNDHLGTRDIDPFTDDQMIDYIINSQIPWNVFMDKPPVIPDFIPDSANIVNDYEREIYERTQPVILEPQYSEMGTFGEPMDEDVKPVKEEYQTMQDIPYQDHQNFYPVYDDYGNMQHFAPPYHTLPPGNGGWLSWDGSIPERPGLFVGGIVIKEEGAVNPLHQVKSGRIEADSEASSTDDYPQLGPKDKGKGRLYQSP